MLNIHLDLKTKRYVFQTRLSTYLLTNLNQALDMTDVGGKEIIFQRTCQMPNTKLGMNGTSGFYRAQHPGLS
jgi:hypothetical protein